MKHLLYIVLLVILSFSISYGHCDLEDCDDPEWNIATDSWKIGDTGCSIWAEFEYRNITCDGKTYSEVRLLGWVAALSSECLGFGTPRAVMDYIYDKLFTGDLPGLIIPSQGQCNSSFVVSGPACWEMVYKTIGPRGPGFYGQPCAPTPNCCKHYKVCRDMNDILSTTPFGYTPVPCGAIIGPESNAPCESNCQ